MNLPARPDARPSRRQLFGVSSHARRGVPAPLSSARDTLITIFLRGGMDGLTAVVPYTEPQLYALRPTLAVRPPGQPNGALDLDGFFGLAPSAAPLLTPWNAGALAIVHACGSTDPTRSHFDAMRFIETATPNMGTPNIGTGLVGRHLQISAPVGAGALRGLVLNKLVPQMHAGAPGVLPIDDPAAFVFPGAAGTSVKRRVVIEALYEHALEPLRSAANSSLATIDLLANVPLSTYVPSNGAVYPSSQFGQALRSIAALLKAGIELEAAHHDWSGWDHHAHMGPVTGTLAGMLANLAQGLQAFYLDLHGDPHGYTLVVQSEFGRRVAQNGSGGTDHGHGGCMLVMGEHVNGGQVFGAWPTLAQLDNGDVQVTTDYRDVLAEVLAVRLGNTNLAHVFPNHAPSFLGLVG